MKRTMTDSQALHEIAERYRLFGEEGIFDDTSSTIEAIGNLIEKTGRQAWFEDPA